MVDAKSRNNLLIMGVHPTSEGYPNTRFRLRDLKASGLFHLTEINVPMWRYRKQNLHGVFCQIGKFGRALFSHVAVMFRYLAVKRPERIYVPYPAVFVLFLLSWLPERFRPQRIVADAFISLYDTVVHDRYLLRKEGLPARLLMWVEKRAYAFADVVVVDTPQNVRFLCSLFNLPESKVVAVPLSTDETNFRHVPYQPHSGTCYVLFVGTLVPLHGVETILAAASLLSDRSDIYFKLIGDGQDAPIVEAWQRKYKPALDWERKWLSSEQVAEEIFHADICLGIFGTGDKTQRVCPFKIYAYAAMGRPIVTGETDWLKAQADDLSLKAFASVPVNDAAALAAKIVELADDPGQRENLAVNSRKFYETHLANQAALEKLVACLLGG
jgi:glycosyltransferase involved in cell wall biosynthesis